jgi:hypothetical protein
MTSYAIEAGLIPTISIGETVEVLRADLYSRVSLDFPGSFSVRLGFAGLPESYWDAGLGVSHIISFRQELGRPSSLFVPLLSYGVSAGIDQNAVVNPALRMDLQGIYWTLPTFIHAEADAWIPLPVTFVSAVDSGEKSLSLPALRIGSDISAFLRVFPRVYLVPAVDAAIAWPTQSTGSGLAGSRVRAGGDSAGDGRLLISVDLLFPIANGLEWKAFNLVILRSIYSCLYFEAESFYSGLALESVDLHAGFELGTVFSTLADKEVPLALGMDFPITRIMQSEGAFWASLFVSTHLPMLLYGAALAY